MDRLISADALMEDIRKHSTSYFADDFAHEWVDKQPTIDPVRHGTWRNYKDEHTCSVCGEVVTGDWMYEDSAYDYCPNCGAKMDGEREEE